MSDKDDDHARALAVLGLNVRQFPPAFDLAEHETKTLALERMLRTDARRLVDALDHEFFSQQQITIHFRELVRAHLVRLDELERELVEAVARAARARGKR